MPKNLVFRARISDYKPIVEAMESRRFLSDI